MSCYWFKLSFSIVFRFDSIRFRVFFYVGEGETYAIVISSYLRLMTFERRVQRGNQMLGAKERVKNTTSKANLINHLNMSTVLTFFYTRNITKK